jgi:uncharacterized protein YjlB
MQAIRLLGDGTIPNNPRLAVLLHRAAIANPSEQRAKALFQQHGWRPAWTDTIDEAVHYHSTAHEALAVVSGHVRARLGGRHGMVVELHAGDVVVLPAGIGHENLAHSPDLQVVGAYPPGQEADMRGPSREGHDLDRARIANLPDPPCDPVTGQPYPPAPRH